METTKRRWTEHMLSSADKPRFLYEYYVSGRGTFPFDMLRFDQAWPATGEDAALLNLDIFSSVQDRVKLRSIKMHSYHEPTIARWSSFIWSVGAEKLT